MALIKRFFLSPKRSFFLLGPRGTGKSTWIKQTFKDAIKIDLLDPAVVRAYLAKPERLYEVSNEQQRVIVIDEIQHAPALLSVVHSMIEMKANHQFILTGSSPRKLKRTQANLLGGRALKRTLHPFMAGELGNHFSLENALKDGMLPLIYNQLDPQDILQAYITLYLREEIQIEGLVRNIENFSRFLEVITFSHASLLNTANVARESEVKRKTVENYIEILEELMLAFRLPVFTKRAKRALISHPKFYLFDAGVFYALRPKGILDKTEEIDGAALEGLIAQHLRAWNDYSEKPHSLTFWRTSSGVEVDFVIYGPSGFWAIEVKNSNRINEFDVKSLKSFQEDYPMAEGILLYRGTERRKIRNIICIPCEEFLLSLKPNEKIV